MMPRWGRIPYGPADSVAQVVADGLWFTFRGPWPSGIHPMADYAVRRRGRRLPSLVRGHERGYWTDEGTFAIDATPQTSILSKRTLIFWVSFSKIFAFARNAENPLLRLWRQTPPQRANRSICGENRNSKFACLS